MILSVSVQHLALNRGLINQLALQWCSRIAALENGDNHRCHAAMKEAVPRKSEEEPQNCDENFALEESAVDLAGAQAEEGLEQLHESELQRSEGRRRGLAGQLCGHLREKARLSPHRKYARFTPTRVQLALAPVG